MHRSHLLDLLAGLGQAVSGVQVHPINRLRLGRCLGLLHISKTTSEMGRFRGLQVNLEVHLGKYLHNGRGLSRKYHLCRPCLVVSAPILLSLQLPRLWDPIMTIEPLCRP
jgi:hypothetical protein